MNEERGSLYLLTGLVIGLLLGLFYAWAIHPVQYFDTSPASLREDYKDRYRVLIAAAYTANGDVVRARARLELLNDDDPSRALTEQAQRFVATGGSADEARSLAVLAAALGAPVPAAATPAPASPAPASTATTGQAAASPPAPSGTGEGTAATAPALPPTQPPAATPGGPFALQSRDQICTPRLEAPLLQVQAYDSSGKAVSGVEAVVTWEGGEEHFFTGLQPEKGLGYADFILTPGVVYTLRLGEGGQPVGDLTALECTVGQERFWGAWLLTFKQQ